MRPRRQGRAERHTRCGYSEATAQGRIYQIIKTPDMRERFQRIANDAALNTNEIIGTLVQQMRFDLADVFPESDFLQPAKRPRTENLTKPHIVTGLDCYQKLTFTARRTCQKLSKT